jgi:chromosome segregation ATPase
MEAKKGSDKGKKEELPKVNEVETISPATRLLNKRRQMYENQEAYKLKKKEF